MYGIIFDLKNYDKLCKISMSKESMNFIGFSSFFLSVDQVTSFLSECVKKHALSEHMHKG